ncbi:two-component sensor histidine kinase [bacterium]|nr:two-component sensor histidine kinase [bacterium]
MKNTTRYKVVKKRLILLFLLCIGFAGSYTMVYRWNILDFNDKLVSLENVYDLFDDILEIKRYEKNLIYFQNPESSKEIVFYLNKAEIDIARISDSIIEVVGAEKFYEFSLNLQQYRAMIHQHIQGNKVDLKEIRERGRTIVDFAQALLNQKKESIHRFLRVGMYLPISILGLFVILIIALFMWQAKGTLTRHAFVQKATEEFARGEFVIHADASKWKDEVSDLILIFNRMAEEIETRQEQLFQSRKMASIGTLTSGIAHELNNPLNNISLTADSLLADCEHMDIAEIRDMVSDIASETTRASEVVKNLLDISRGDEPSFVPLHLKSVVKDTLKILKNQLMLASVKYVSNIPDDLPKIRGNKDKLIQVFLNLFLNAIQAMPDGGTISVDGKKDPDGYVRIDFKDTGIGMKVEDLGKIFDPFFTTKPVGKGTGLGLSIVYGIISKHKGYIEVKSELNLGTTFSIFLPIPKWNKYFYG